MSMWHIGSEAALLGPNVVVMHLQRACKSNGFPPFDPLLPINYAPVNQALFRRRPMQQRDGSVHVVEGCSSNRAISPTAPET
jgi:hypothetical protein